MQARVVCDLTFIDGSGLTAGDIVSVVRVVPVRVAAGQPQVERLVVRTSSGTLWAVKPDQLQVSKEIADEQ
jgi:hypothetical protein